MLAAMVFVSLGSFTVILAQPELKKEDIERIEKRRKEALHSLETLADLLKSSEEQKGVVAALKVDPRDAKEAVTKKELEAKIATESGKLAQIDAQIAALSTGIGEDQRKDDQKTEFDLKNELEGLIQPFIKMMRDATENTRQIEKLKSTILAARQRQSAAEQAHTRLALWRSIEKQEGEKEPVAIDAHLSKFIKRRKKRDEEAQASLETAQRQLQLRLDQQANAPSGIGIFATQYFRNRTRNLFVGLAAFAGMFIAMDLIARLADYIRRRRGYRRSFATRLTNLIFRTVTTLLAFLAMLAVFNMMNDWLLLGIAVVFVLAAAWIGLKMLPQLIE
jgi:hypothetical protein